MANLCGASLDCELFLIPFNSLHYHMLLSWQRGYRTLLGSLADAAEESWATGPTGSHVWQHLEHPPYGPLHAGPQQPLWSSRCPWPSYPPTGFCYSAVTHWWAPLWMQEEPSPIPAPSFSSHPEKHGRVRDISLLILKRSLKTTYTPIFCLLFRAGHWFTCCAGSYFFKLSFLNLCKSSKEWDLPCACPSLQNLV